MADAADGDYARRLDRQLNESGVARRMQELMGDYVALEACYMDTCIRRVVADLVRESDDDSLQAVAEIRPAARRVGVGRALATRGRAVRVAQMVAILSIDSD